MADPVDETHIYVCVRSGSAPSVWGTRTSHAIQPDASTEGTHRSWTGKHRHECRDKTRKSAGKGTVGESRVRESVVAPMDEWREET